MYGRIICVCDSGPNFWIGWLVVKFWALWRVEVRVVKVRAIIHGIPSLCSRMFHFKIQGWPHNARKTDVQRMQKLRAPFDFMNMIFIRYCYTANLLELSVAHHGGRQPVCQWPHYRAWGWQNSWAPALGRVLVKGMTQIQRRALWASS